MAEARYFAELPSRAVIMLSGDGWREFLQGLITQDVQSLQDGELRFAALLAPQGRLLYDLFLVSTPEGCLIDCAAEHRESLMGRLGLYKLRAKVTIAPSDVRVSVCWGGEVALAGWLADPRHSQLGARGYGASIPTDSRRVDEAAFESHNRRLGVPCPTDWRPDTIYPIEANFDLLGGIDFKKGCFVGQETTSRMKRRGVIKSRMAPISFEGDPPPFGSELLAADLRVGQVLSGESGLAMAMLRLDRLKLQPLRLDDGRSWFAVPPAWLSSAIHGDGA